MASWVFFALRTPRATAGRITLKQKIRSSHYLWFPTKAVIVGQPEVEEEGRRHRLLDRVLADDAVLVVI